MDGTLRDATLLLCERQLAGALADAEVSVRRLTEEFVAARRLLVALDPETPEAADRIREITRCMDAASVGLQFLDEHSQRLVHVGKVLDLLMESPGAAEHANVSPDWQPFLNRVRALLSTEREWRIFATVFPGEDVGHHQGDGIELF
jgi:hypothetical protein